MQHPIKIAVLITTFNRKAKTLTCLKSLNAQELTDGVTLDVHITDDASADGTPEAIQQQYPAVNLYKGTGQLFWAGGMRHTWKKALQSSPQYYLLLNDDTVLYPNAITTLLDCVSKQSHAAICIGSTVDVETGKQSYGGSRLTAKGKWQSAMIPASDTSTACDFANANIMLVPTEVVSSIGILSEGYTHSLADYDYTLKAKKTGFKLVVAPGFLGTCKDDHGNNWKSSGVPLRQRIAYLKSPKGLAYSEYLLFIKRHFPTSYPTAFFKLWLKTLFPFLWDTFKNKSAVH